MGSRFTHLSSTDSYLFLFMDEWYPIVCIYHTFFIHSSVYKHLGCFYVLAIANRAAVNIGVHQSFWIRVLISFGYIPRSGIIFLAFWETSILFSIVAAPIFICTNSVRGFPFLHTLSSICYLQFLMMAILTAVRFPWFLKKESRIFTLYQTLLVLQLT